MRSIIDYLRRGLAAVLIVAGSLISATSTSAAEDTLALQVENFFREYNVHDNLVNCKGKSRSLDSNLNFEYYKLEFPERDHDNIGENVEMFFMDYHFGERAYSFSKTIDRVFRFVNQYDRIPEDGMELLYGVDKNVSTLFDPRDSIHNGQMESGFTRYLIGFNPATGKYIDDFFVDEWEPYGIRINLIGDVPKNELLSYSGLPQDSNLVPLGGKKIHLVIFGESVNSIAYEATLSRVYMGPRGADYESSL